MSLSDDVLREPCPHCDDNTDGFWTENIGGKDALRRCTLCGETFDAGDAPTPDAADALSGNPTPAHRR